MTDVEEFRPVSRPGSDSEEAEADTWWRLEANMRSHAAAGLANIGRSEVTQHGGVAAGQSSLTHNVIMAVMFRGPEQSLASTFVITALVLTLGNWITLHSTTGLGRDVALAARRKRQHLSETFSCNVPINSTFFLIIELNIEVSGLRGFRSRLLGYLLYFILF